MTKGRVNPKHTLEDQGISGLGNVYYNLLEPALIEEALKRGIEDGSIAPCDVRMTGNAIMGALNWVPKWFHGDAAVATKVVAEFPQILSAGLASGR